MGYLICSAYIYKYLSADCCNESVNNNLSIFCHLSLSVFCIFIKMDVVDNCFLDLCFFISTRLHAGGFP